MKTSMLTFTSVDTLKIEGRGLLYTGKMPEDTPVADVKGKTVLIDGREAVCLDIERFVAHHLNPVLWKGEGVGLLVKE